VGPRAGLDRCGKSRPPRDSIPVSSSPQRVATPTELCRLHPSGSLIVTPTILFQLPEEKEIVDFNALQRHTGVR